MSARPVDPRTEAAHRRIEQLAGELLDVKPRLGGRRRDPRAERTAETAAELNSTVEQAASASAMAGNEASVHYHQPGPQQILRTAALLDVLFSIERTPLEWCPHRKDIHDGGRTFVVAFEPFRFAGCGDCGAERIRDDTARAKIARTTHCDVCGAQGGIVQTRTIPFESAVITLRVGVCCRALFDYRQSEAIVRIRRADADDEAGE